MYILSAVVCVILVIADQASKYIALEKLEPIGTITIIQGIFSLTFVENRGAAFGMLQGARIAFLISTPLILAAMVYYFIKLPYGRVYSFMRAAIVMITAGAIGNFIDRLFRGYVIDFLHATFINFPVFNFADILVVTGTFLMAILLIFFIKDEPGLVE